MTSSGSARGAALPETALVLTATLAMFFGIIQIGIIGFLQIMVDGAAFIAAHEYALGNTGTYVATAKNVFPLMGVPQPDVNYPDSTAVDVVYGTGVNNQRHGGVGLIRSSHAQMTVTNSAPSGLLGVGIANLSNLSIHGSAIEPQNQISNSDYDVAGATYSGTAAAQVDLFTNMQNAPAAYINMETMLVCDSPGFGPTCNSNYSGLALGNAEYLDYSNWGVPNLGIGAPAGSYTFGAMLYHQQVYAQAAQILTQMPTDALLQALNLSKTSPTNGNRALVQIYSWDYDMRLGSGYAPSETQFGAFPMHPLNGAP
jgi:hypothetical protein